MVLQKTIDNLRERPHDERRAVALGVAIAVMVILFIGWAIFFVRSIQTSQVLPAIQYDDFSTQTAASAAIDTTGWVSTPQDEPTDPSEIELIDEGGSPTVQQSAQ